MDPRLEKQLNSMDHPFFKERPKPPEPFYAKRLKAMDPTYERTREEVDIEVRVREMSRSLTLTGDERGLSRSSTLTGEEKELSRTSTLNDMEKDISRSSTLVADEKEMSGTSMLKFDERDMSRGSMLKLGSPDVIKKAHRGRRSLAWAVVSQVIGLLWLTPIITLLTLNYKNFIIGASIWCPGGHCSADLFSTRAIQEAAKLDNQDHNLIGALQYVSKALEVWFVFISTSLVYDVAMLLAKRGGGLPVGFLLTHLEFADIRYLMNPLLWTSPIPHPSASPRIRALVTGKLYLFVLLVASLTILTNLMGPAAAVLIIPTLQWVETPHVPDLVFNGTNAAWSPGGTDAIPGCTLEELDVGNFSCSAKIYGPSLDSYADATMSTAKQGEQEYGNFLLSTSQEGSVQFAINVSDSGNLIWSPNRFALRDLSYDALDFGQAVFNRSSSKNPPPNYNNSLATILQRESISLGVSTQCYYGNISNIFVDNDRVVSCHEGWHFFGDDPSNYTMCFQRGVWSNLTMESFFRLGHSNSSVKDPMIEIWAYFSEKATYFNETTDFGTGIQACFNGESPCDWEKIFAAELPHDFRNLTSNVQIVEYKIPNTPWPAARKWCDWYTYLGFPTYSFDVSDQGNPLRLVQLNNLPDVSQLGQPLGQPEVVDPSWLLVAWSVEDEGTVDGLRPITKAFIETLTSVSTATMSMEFSYLHTYTLCQAVSLIDWAWADPQNISEVATSTGPIFTRYATLHVWTYGLSDKTSKLGVAVAILGIACVIVRLILAVVFRFRHEHSALELFVAALKHKPEGEFDGLDDELELAKVRFKMSEGVDGKAIFFSERRGTEFSESSKDDVYGNSRSSSETSTKNIYGQPKIPSKISKEDVGVKPKIFSRRCDTGFRQTCQEQEFFTERRDTGFSKTCHAKSRGFSEPTKDDVCKNSRFFAKRHGIGLSEIF